MAVSAKGFHTKEGAGTLFEGVMFVEGQRTPFGKYTGALSTVSPTDLGILASRAVIKKAGVKAEDIAQVIVSNIGQASADSFFFPAISAYMPEPRWKHRRLWYRESVDRELRSLARRRNRLLSARAT